MTTTNEAMLLIQTLDSDAHLRFSEYRWNGAAFAEEPVHVFIETVRR